jgi:hypothetical protein
MFADDNDARKLDDNESIDIVDKELEESFNAWKSKTYALTVPLKVVALRGSIPPSWIKVCDKHSSKFVIAICAVFEILVNKLSSVIN